eukprot:COSAG01_NODE_44506_length_418_cov_1.310345_1_plen_56_part_10
MPKRKRAKVVPAPREKPRTTFHVPGLDIFPMGWGSEVLICPICLAGVVGGRLWLTG